MRLTGTKYWTFAIVSSISLLKTNAQSSAEHKQHFFLGSVSTTNVDDRFLNVHLNKLIPAGGEYTYTIEGPRSKKVLDLAASTGTGNDDENHVKYYTAAFSYSRGFAIQKNKAAAFRNYLGYTVSVNSSGLRTGDNYSWASSVMASLYNSAVYSWKKSSLSLDIIVPAIGFVSRPSANTTYKYSVDGMMYNSFSNLSFSSFHNQQAVTAALQYQLAFSQRWLVVGGIGFSYKKINETAIYLEQAYKINAGIVYRPQ